MDSYDDHRKAPRRRDDGRQIAGTLFYCALFVAGGYVAGRMINAAPTTAADPIRQAASPAPAIVVGPPPADVPTPAGSVAKPRPADSRSTPAAPLPPEIEPAPRAPRNRVPEESTRIPTPAQSPPKALSQPVTDRKQRMAANSSTRTVLGSWIGAHTGHRARLALDRQEGNSVLGTMTVRTGGRSVRIAVRGTLDPGSGAIRLEETGVLNAPKTAWDVGTNHGRIEGASMAGRGRDSRGRRYSWSFTRER